MHWLFQKQLMPWIIYAAYIFMGFMLLHSLKFIILHYRYNIILITFLTLLILMIMVSTFSGAIEWERREKLKWRLNWNVRYLPTTCVLYLFTKSSAGWYKPYLSRQFLILKIKLILLNIFNSSRPLSLVYVFNFYNGTFHHKFDLIFTKCNVFVNNSLIHLHHLEISSVAS